MQIAQMLQIVPPAAQTSGTASEAAGTSSGEAGLFAALFAGLLGKPVEMPAGAQLLAGTAKTAASTKEQSAKTDETASVQAPVVALAPVALVSTSTAIPLTDPTATTATAGKGGATPVTAQPTHPSADPTGALPVAKQNGDDTGSKQSPKQESLVASTTSTAMPSGNKVFAVPPGEAVEVLQVTVADSGCQPAVGGKLAAGGKLPEVPLPDESTTSQQPVGDKSEVRTAALTTAPAGRLVVPARSGGQDGRQIEAAAPETKGTEPSSGESQAPKVEVVVRKELGEQQFADHRELAGDRKEGDTGKDQGMPQHVASDGSKATPTVPDNRSQSSGETQHALRDSVMSQVKDALAARQSAGNGQIAIKLNPAELGELRINVHVVDQHVKVEVLAANSQVRDVLLNNLDSLKESFARQNLTMSGFNVSTGGGQGSGHFFRDAWGNSQGMANYSLGQSAAEELPVAVNTTDYYTDRRDNSLVDVRF